MKFPTRRPLGDKLQELAQKSPEDLKHLEKLVDLVLDRVDHPHPKR